MTFQSVDRAVDRSFMTVDRAVDRSFAVHVVHTGRPGPPVDRALSRSALMPFSLSLTSDLCAIFLYFLLSPLSLHRQRTLSVTNNPAQIKRTFRFIIINFQQIRTFAEPLLPDQENVQLKTSISFEVLPERVRWRSQSLRVQVLESLRDYPESNNSGITLRLQVLENHSESSTRESFHQKFRS